MLMQRTRSKPSASATTSATFVSGLNASPTWSSWARAARATAGSSSQASKWTVTLSPPAAAIARKCFSGVSVIRWQSRAPPNPCTRPEIDSSTIGPIVLESISGLVHGLGGALDCHLMTETPEKHFRAIAAAGGDSVTVHFEACDELPAVARAARAHELQVGLAFKPETNVADVVAEADGFDLVLCMSIEPGYSGQPFMPEAFDRIRRLRELLPPEQHIQVDGGVGADNIRQVHEAGADLLVAGSAIFAKEDLTRAYRRLV